MRKNEPRQILLVEDNSTDIELTREALEASKMLTNLHVVQDGVAAMAFLRKESPYCDVPMPDLVLLDLNMPKKDGRQVLEEMKRDEALKAIPVVVLTGSASEADILRSYKLGANCYITKPVGLKQFITVVRSIDNFWFKVVKLPTRATNDHQQSFKSR